MLICHAFILLKVSHGHGLCAARRILVPPSIPDLVTFVGAIRADCELPSDLDVLSK